MTSTDTTPLVSLRGVRKYFQMHRGTWGRGSGVVRAVDGVSFDVNPGEVVGLVGESGSGKTTVGRMIVKLVEPTQGDILVEGKVVSQLDESAFKPYRKKLQIIFQDPFSSLDPRLRADKIISEGLIIHGIGSAKERAERVIELLEMVGLPADAARRFPHQFSGGQRQRLGIARALAVAPRFIVADEPVSALDVSVQAQIINLLDDLQRDMGLTMVFISHDLSVVNYLCDRVIVMYLGRIVEIAPTDALFSNPKHPYTEALLSAIPNPDPDVRSSAVTLSGDVPSITSPHTGCIFRTRCAYAIPDCAVGEPVMRKVGPNHEAACIRTGIL